LEQNQIFMARALAAAAAFAECFGFSQIKRCGGASANGTLLA